MLLVFLREKVCYEQWAEGPEHPYLNENSW